MKQLLASIALLFFHSAFSIAAEGVRPATERPNIVFLLADDLGYGDIGAYGQTKIETPNLDRLAAAGMALRTHYSGNSVCAPSRCVLMTGYHPGHAFIRDNRQYKPNDPKSEGQYPLPDETVTLPELLKQSGYVTGAFGKWGLGAPETSGEPLRQGIDRFFGFNCQAVAHNSYPTYLWNNREQIRLDNPEFAAHQKFPKDSAATMPGAFDRYRGATYAPDRITEEALAFIDANRDQPFFLFYPTTVPHLALQVPQDSVEPYLGRFPESPYLGDRGYLPNPNPHATYAAMVSRLDREVGRILDRIESHGLTNNTIFVFSSDNGPLYDQLGGTDTDFFQSAGIFRGRKGSLYEGGIRVPCLVAWRGQIQPGTETNRITGFEDWLPTLLELAGQSSRIPSGIDGISLVPSLIGKSQPERAFLYREMPGYGGQQTIRVGNWKAVRQRLNPNLKKNEIPGELELYDLANDPRESEDVAAKFPEKSSELQRLLDREHVPSKLFPLRAIDSK